MIAQAADGAGRGSNDKLSVSQDAFAKTDSSLLFPSVVALNFIYAR
jgi:hypothetical protein